MKTILIIIAAAGIVGLGFIAKSKTGLEPKETVSKILTGSYAPVAVLELFTSEGCSSCPSADKLLPQLALLDSNVIPLSFHVDYWNRLGWTDPFSNSEYSERQRNYSRQLNLESVYTPQLVINGEYELVGSNRSKAEAAIKNALQDKSLVQLSIENVEMNTDKIRFQVHSEGDIKKTNLLAALVQKQVTMNVKAGENRGSKLSHTNVVRILEMQPTTGKNDFEMSVPANLANENWELIVYTQQKNNYKITGASIYKPLF